MLKIKLAHFGKKKQPRYRFVIAEANSKRDSGYVAEIGQYSPTLNPKILILDIKAYHEWLKKGAQPTATVASLALRFESGNPFPTKKVKPSKKALAAKQKKNEISAQESKPEAKVAAKKEEIEEEVKIAVSEKTQLAKNEIVAEAKNVAEPKIAKPIIEKNQ